MPQWYAIVEAATGRLLSTGTVLAEAYPPELTVYPLGAEPDFGRCAWDPVLRRFVPLDVPEGGAAPVVDPPLEARAIAALGAAAAEAADVARGAAALPVLDAPSGA